MGRNPGWANSPYVSRNGLGEQEVAQASPLLESALTAPVPGDAPLNCLICWYWHNERDSPKIIAEYECVWELYHSQRLTFVFSLQVCVFKSCNHPLEPQSPNPVLWMGRVNLWRTINWASTCGEQKASVSRIHIQINTSAPALSLPAWPCSCVPASAYLAAAPAFPTAPGPLWAGIASPTSQALSLYLAPALLNSQLLLFHQLVTSSLSCRLLFPLAQAHSIWAAGIFFSSSIKPQLSEETGSSLSLLPGAFE